MAGVIEKEEANFFATIDAGLDRIERLFKHMNSEGREMVSGAEAAEMYRPTAFRPNCSKPWPPSTTWPSIGTASSDEMEQHGKTLGRRQKRRAVPVEPAWTH